VRAEELARFSPRALLQALTAHGVDFVLIGGVAVNFHGVIRLTKDLDICFSRNRENLEALGHALTGLNARLRGVEEGLPVVADAVTLDRVELLTLETDAGPIDVHVRPKGAPAYDTLRRRAIRAELEGFNVLVASIDDMLKMKRASARPQDLLDVQALEEVRLRERRKRS
jgi:hypothetical protein